MEPPSTRLSVNKLGVNIGALRLLEDISFSLTDHQALILRGGNGIGKTSLLRILSGITQRQHGEVHYGTDTNPKAYDIRTNAHFLGHKNGLKDLETVRENLEFICKFLGGKREDFLSALSVLNLRSLLDMPVRVLSAGQKRRVAFATLLISKRKIWFLDEPTSALDQAVSQLIEDICSGHLKTGGIIIAATHLPFLESQDPDLIRSLDLGQYVPLEKWIEA